MRGGKRQGAGRKQGFAAKSAEEARRVFAERVAEEIGPICDVLLRRARMGDIRAIRELLDRAWGRPSQAVQIETTQLPTPLLQNLNFDKSFDKNLTQSD